MKPHRCCEKNTFLAAWGKRLLLRTFGSVGFKLMAALGLVNIEWNFRQNSIAGHVTYGGAVKEGWRDEEGKMSIVCIVLKGHP